MPANAQLMVDPWDANSSYYCESSDRDFTGDQATISGSQEQKQIETSAGNFSERNNPKMKFAQNFSL